MLDTLPQAISSFAPSIDQMLYLIYYITGAFFIGMEGYLIYLVVRYRQKKGTVAKYEPGNTWAQIQWIIVFSVVILALDLSIDIKGGKPGPRLRKTCPPPI